MKPSWFRNGCVVFSLLVLAGCAASPRVLEPAAQPLPPAAPANPITLAPTTPSAESEALAKETDAEQEPDSAPVVVVSVSEQDLWARIRRGFALADIDNPMVHEHENWYSNRPDYVGRMTERSQLYLFHIVEEVERRKLPSEIALLPMVESAFNPKAYSRSHASGIWQFIPSTGKHFGLDQNWWYDGRRNVLAATNAALDYLQRLYGMFGSWELALAAYNAGEGTVSRAIAANRARGLPTDYENLRLPPETRNYVPKLQAIKNIIAHPDAFGLTLNDLPNKPFFSKVVISKHIDVALAARFADMTLEEFRSLNPAYTKPVITHTDNEVLLLPSANIDIFKANMQRYANRQLHSWQAYQGRKGERVDKIAARHGITAAQLRHFNSVQEKRGKLKSAQLLLVPIKLSKPLPTAAQIASTRLPPPPVARKAAPQNYVVQKGDTLFALAQRFDTTVEDLRDHNRLTNDSVNVGDSISIPDGDEKIRTMPEDNDIVAQEGNSMMTTKVSSIHKAQLHVAPTGRTVRTAKSSRPVRSSFYTVQRGDTLSGIAQTFQVAIKDLMRWNHLRSRTRLMPGSKIKVASTS